MQPNILKRAKASWLNMALATGSMFNLGTAQAYYRTREAYPNKVRYYASQPGFTSSRLDLSVPTFSLEMLNSSSLSPDHEIGLIQGQQVRELIIVDEAVPQKQVFYAQAKPGVEVVALNSSENGLTALLNVLSQYKNLDAVHLVSHAKSGTLQLGDEQVTEEDLQAHPRAFEVINQAIKPQGDFLFYGCELGKGEAGEEFLEIIQNHTHTDLAASDDLTGNSNFKGDWELEISRGNIDAVPIGGSPALIDFTGTLQTFNFTGTDVVDPGGTTPSDDVHVNETGSGTTYTMVIDGASQGVNSNPAYRSYCYLGYDGAVGVESSVTFSFSMNQEFDPTSLNISNLTYPSNRRFTFTSDVSGSVTTASLAPTIAPTAVDLSALAPNTTVITITSPDGMFKASLDDIVVTNIVTPGPFPVTLMDFQVQRLEETVTLHWSTAKEENNHGFGIEQSFDGGTFEQIGFVEGAGNSSEEESYSYTVRNTEAAYYRFKQVDLDGNHSYSPTRFIASWEPVKEPLIYPNPIANEVFIGNLGDDQDLIVDIIDLQGRKLANIEGRKIEVEQQLSEKFKGLTQGIYFVNMRTPNRSFVQKVIKE